MRIFVINRNTFSSEFCHIIIKTVFLPMTFRNIEYADRLYEPW